MLLDFGFHLKFYSSYLTIYYDNVYYGCGFQSNSFMILDMDVEWFSVLGCFSLIASSSSTLNDTTWYARFGHNSQHKITRLSRNNLLGQLANVRLPTCEYCLVSKSTKKPFA